MDFFVWLPIILRLIDLAPKIQQTLSQKQSVPDLINGLAPDLLPVLKDIGSTLFPNISPAHQVNASVLGFDVEHVKDIQTELNRHGASPQLVVDGKYGEGTKAAVRAFQTAHHLTVDGWAGNDTMTELVK